MKQIYELFWNSSLEELKKGYVFSEIEEQFTCLICGKTYENGVVYKLNDKLMTAERMIKEHILDEHQSTINALLKMDKKYTGLSDIQTEILNLFNSGLNDSKIAQKMKISNSNVRNHRFRLKEKAKQAKVFLAIYELLDENTSSKEKIIDIHRTAVQVDERYAITQEEREKCLKVNYDADGVLLKFPNKEKEKLIILFEIIKSFDTGKTYTEKEVNKIIKNIYADDFPLIRRYLIEYGFIDRKPDGSSYWVRV